jgi:spore germination protein YaaH
MENLLLRSAPKKPNKIFTSMILLFILISATLLYFLFPFASSEKTNYLSGVHSILVKGNIHGNAYRNGNITYIPITTFKEQVDSTIYLEKNSMIITTKLKVIRIAFDKDFYEINGTIKQSTFPIIKSVGNREYIALEGLQEIYPIRYHITKNKGTVWIQKDGDQYYKGHIIAKKVRSAYLRLRTKPDLQSPYVTEVKRGESIHIEHELKDYYFVRTSEGIGGYLKKAYVKKNNLEHVQIPFTNEVVSLPKIKKPIQLSWESVYTKSPDPKQLPAMPGVNVVSPTWFHLKNGNGDFSNLSSKPYIKWAKQHHMQVWALFSNSSNPDMTRAAFSTFDKRHKIIQQIVKMLNQEHLDGLNIDIENVRPEDGPLVTQFVREITAYLHASNKYVSMDITFIAKGNWSEFYERDKLGKIVDYLIIMAYDEHWANSPTAGSVASLPWVENNLQPILKIVPHDKVVLGVPFYTRLWKEKMVDGLKTTSSKALTMKQAKFWIEEHKLKVQMDSETEQHYVEYSDSKTNTTYKMWMEDEYSLSKRANIVGQYHLAGVASWARSFANEQAWMSLQSTLSAYEKK